MGVVERSQSEYDQNISYTHIKFSKDKLRVNLLFSKVLFNSHAF